MSLTIEINNTDCKIMNQLNVSQLSVLQEICSFEVEGSEFKANAFRSKGIKWDGRRRLFNIQSQRFPIGLLGKVVKELQNAGVDVNIANKRKYINEEINYICKNYSERQYQYYAIFKSITSGNGIIKAATGCFTGDTMIQVNKSSKGSKQTIESLYCSWHGIVRKISKYGTIGNQPIRNKDQVYVRGLRNNSIGLNKVLDVICKGEMNTIRLTFDDGTILKCTPDHKLYDADNMVWVRADQFLGLNIGKDTVKPIKSITQKKKLYDTYFIVPENHPYAVMVKSSRNGVYHKIEMHRAIYEAHVNGYNNINEWRDNIGKIDMIYVDTSIYDIHHIDFNHYNNDIGNLQIITKGEHRKLHNTYKNFGQGTICKTKCIDIEDNGIQVVYDICCEEYHSYTANGLVVHNSGKTTIAARTIATLKKKAIFVVHTKDLLYQTKESFERMFPNEIIGQIGDGIIDYQNITVATMQSLSILGSIKFESYKYDEDSNDYKESIELDKKRAIDFHNYRHSIGTVMFDEVQRVCSRTAYASRFLFDYANYAFGYSASPWRDDGSDLMIEAAFGERIVDISASELIDAGYLVKPIIDIYKIDSTWSGKTYDQVYKSAIVENTVRNIRVANDAIDQYKLGRNTLILVTQIKHGETLEKLILSMGIPTVFISGKSGSKKRRQVIQDMRDGKAPIVIASTIADVGLDVPRLQSIVEAGAGKSSVTALQRLGRIMRPFDKKDLCYFITYHDNVPYIGNQIDKKIAIWSTEPNFIINRY